MASVNVETECRDFFCVRNILATVATTRTPISNTTYFADILATGVNPFPALIRFDNAPYRTLEVTNDSDATVLILVNGRDDNILHIPPRSTKTFGLEFKLFYHILYVYTSAIVAANGLTISGRRF